MAGLLELRIHGVSGTPPHEILGVADGQVTPADGDTSFHRALKPADTSGPPLPAGAEREAYSWGALTSSAAGALGWLQRALWLTLLPFALVNVAMWSRPALLERGVPRTATAVLIRIAGLLLTAVLVVTACGIGIDLVAWQCFRGGVPGCPSLPAWLGFLGNGWFSAPGRRLAVGQVLPLLALLLLWWLARITVQRYEAYVSRADLAGGAAQAHGTSTRALLAEPDMWQGEARTRRLTYLHLTFGICVVVIYTDRAAAELDALHWAGLTAWVAAGLVSAALVVTVRAVTDQVEFADDRPAESPPIQPEKSPPQSDDEGDRALRDSRLLVLGLIALAIRYIVGRGEPDDRRPPPAPSGPLMAPAGQAPPPTPRVALGLLGAAVVMLVANTALLMGGGAGEDGVEAVEAGQALGLGEVSGALFLVLVVIVLAVWAAARDRASVLLVAGLGVTCVIVAVVAAGWSESARFGSLLAAVGLALVACGGLHWATQDRRRTFMWGGAAPSVLLGAAVLVAFLFSTSLTLLAANWLNGGRGVSSLANATPDVVVDAGTVRLGEDATLSGGALQITGEAIHIVGGQLRSATLQQVLEDGAIVRDISSTSLTEAAVELPEQVLALSKVCVTGLYGAPPTSQTGTLQIASITGTEEPTITAGSSAVGGGLPPECSIKPLSVDAITTSTAIDLVIPATHAWFSAVMPIGLLSWIVGLLVLFVVLSRTMQRIPAGGRSAARAWRRAAFAHRAESAMGWCSVPVAAGAVVVAAGAATGALPGRVFPTGWAWWRWITEVGLWTSLGVGLILVGVGARMRGSGDLRRAVGIVWDIVTFWPRVAHPFGPPCYAERVVPEVTARLTGALDAGRHIVVSGHSQGSTIGVAALLQLHGRLDGEKAGWPRVRFISYGTQLRAWFGRIFPDVLGPDILGHAPTGRASFRCAEPDVPVPGAVHRPPKGSLADLLAVGTSHPQWRSLFRRTDPIGFRVHQDTEADPGAPSEPIPVDHYVPETDPAPNLYTTIVVHTHSNYQKTEQYREVVSSWFDEVN